MINYTLLKFEADWCHPCKATGAALTKALAEQPKDTFVLTTIDIADDPLTATQYQVRSLPTVVVLDHELFEVARHVGSLNLGQARGMLDSLRGADSIQ